MLNCGARTSKWRSLAQGREEGKLRGIYQVLNEDYIIECDGFRGSPSRDGGQRDA